MLPHPPAAGQQRHGAKRDSHSQRGSNDAAASSSADHSSKRARSSAAAALTSRPSAHAAPTVRDLITDTLAPLANSYWAPGAPHHEPFDAQIIEVIYDTHLAPTNSKQKEREAKEAEEKAAKDERKDAAGAAEDSDALRTLLAEEEAEQSTLESQRSQRLLLLELSAYLENYLWKHFDPSTATFAHVVSIVMLVNQKFKGENRVGIWDPFHSRPAEVFVAMLERIARLKAERDLSMLEANQLLLFFIHAFESFEDASVRKVFMKLASVDCWRTLRDSSVLRVLRTTADGEGSRAPSQAEGDLRAVWKKVCAKPSTDFAATFLPNLLSEFVHILYAIDDSHRMFRLSDPQSNRRVRRLPYAVRDHLVYLERFLEFLIGLVSKLSTRRWAKKLIEEIHLIVLCQQATLVRKTREKEREIAEKQAEMAKRGTKGSGSDAMDLEALSASTASAGGAILSLDNYSNTNAALSASALPGRLFCQLLDLLQSVLHFEIDDVSGLQLGAQEVLNRHYLDIQILQKICFKFFQHVPQLLNVALANVSRLDNEQQLREMLQGLNRDQLRDLCIRMQLLPRDEEVEEYKKASAVPAHAKKSKSAAAPAAGVPRLIVPLLSYMQSSSFLLSLLLSTFVLRPSTRSAIDSMPLYPSESLLFDETSVPSQNYTGDSCLALPKLNLQFLTVHDYLTRNFQLYKGESTYEIREDIAYTLKRLKPRVGTDGSTVFTGWARMSCPLMSFAVTSVAKPLIGESKPASVRAEITIDLSVFNGIVREEWEQLRQHDVLFLLSVQALTPISASSGNAALTHSRQTGDGSDRSGRRKADMDGLDLEGGVAPEEAFAALASEPLFVKFVRGAEVKSVLDGHKKIIGERDDKGNVYKARGSIRVYRVELDAAQYGLDQRAEIEGGPCFGGAPVSQVYSSFNLVLRRKAKENNFRSVLETIRNLMSDSSAGQAVLPPWLERVFLGYGDPKESQYYRLPTQLPRIEFIDTFLDLQHLRDSFAENITIAERSSEEIEAELQGEKQMNLVALGGEANNRQTAAYTSIQLTRQVMRLVAQAQKEKAKSAAGAASADAAAAVSASADPTESTFRVSFPLQVEPNYEVLQHLLYVRGAGSLDAPKDAQAAETAGVDFILAEGEETIKTAEAATGKHDDEEEEQDEAAAAAEDEEPEEGEIEEGEIDAPMGDAEAPAAPVLPELVAPPAFKLKAPAPFTMHEPAKPVAETAKASAAAPAAPAEAASASTTSDSASVESEIAALHSLTVPKLKDLMKPLGLSLVGVKAVLIERLSESMRESAKAAAAPAAAADDSAMTDAPAAAASSASADVTATYEKDLAAFRAAQSAHAAEQAAFDAARQEHEAAEAAYHAAQAAQKQTLKDHAAAVKAWEKAHKKPTSAKKSSPAKSKKASPAKSNASGKKHKTSKKAAPAAPSAAASSSSSAAPAPAFVIPASPHTLSVELLPRVSSRTDYTRRNPIRFTPVQVEAIKSGLNPGLTMIVGPPGTGKTDTAVQIISELYHNFPEQRTLLITHSNHALNDLFEKIMLRDIDERYLLRLGRGSDELATESDMGKFGRVNFMLARRLTLLEEVGSLARSLNMSDDVAYTCETAGHFFLAHILARWEKFTSDVQAAQRGGAASNAPPGLEASIVSATFPFTAYFASKQEKQRKIWEAFYGVSQQEPAAAPASAGATSMELDDKSAAASSSASSAAAAYVAATAAAASSNSLFPGRSLSEDMSLAVSCFADLQKTFVELEETRPFELLRSYKDRSNYLLTKHAKIIAMTCTHAAIMRGNLVDLGFAFDNVVMEESAQILEIETFIPLLLQRADPERGSRLQRVILLGDHHQLPPVIANRAFQKYSHLDQSLFTRFIRLGMPYIQLNAQGRMRPSLANLWNWKYQALGNLPVIRSNPAYQFGNPGLRHEFQMIDVPDLNGVGESSPTPFFYQNLGEAEYVVQLFMYMRLLGYAANRISILTTYNGQKHLIREILEQRCARNPLFGMPNKVSTVDKFQGQQNDFILLSLVRTRTAGHLRDVRRLVVAMSRARLGLYLFGRVSLFTNCFELTRTFNQLLQKPVKLQILPHEKRPMDQPLATERLAAAEVDPTTVLEVRDVVHMGELVASMTLSVQSEFGEYHRRIHAAQEEERIKREQQEQLRRQYEEAREATRREDARLAMQATRDAQHQREQEAMDREMAMEQAEQTAAISAASPISEDDSDEEP